MSDASALVDGKTVVGYLRQPEKQPYPNVICTECGPKHYFNYIVKAVTAYEAAAGELRRYGYHCWICNIEIPYPHIRPEVGMGATEHLWSDRHAYTIIEVSPSLKTIKLQADNSRRIDTNGMSEVQEYEFTPNPKGPTRVACLRADGRYHIGGVKGNPVSIGYRDAYYDFTL